MKKVFFFLLSLPLVMTAQVATEGEVIYEDIVKIEFTPPPGMPQPDFEIPDERRQKLQLLFSSTASAYQKYDDPNAPVEDPAQGGRWMRFIMRGVDANYQMYKNLEEGRKVEQQEFMDKKFLIKDELDQFTWKMTGEQKQLGSYLVMKAVMEDSVEAPRQWGQRNREGAEGQAEGQRPRREMIARTIEAWFTPQIPVPTGPAQYGQLPGLILEMKIGDNHVIRAVSVEVKDIDEKELAEPTKGKEVTQEEYRQIVREKMIEMRQQQGGGPRTAVIRQD